MYLYFLKRPNNTNSLLTETQVTSKRNLSHKHYWEHKRMKEVEYVYASMYVYYKLRGLYDVLCLATAPTYANNQIFVS